MKITAIILAILCVASLMVLGYLYFTSDIAVTWELVRDEKGNNGIQVIQRPEQFEAVREAMAAGGAELGDPSGYEFYEWSVTIANNTRIPMDTLEISVPPESVASTWRSAEGAFEVTVFSPAHIGMVAMLQTEPGQNLDPGQKREVTFTVLAEKSALPELPIRITWYLWGRMSEKSLTLKLRK